MSEPLIRMRTEESRKAWLQGWLSAYGYIANELMSEKPREELIEILAAAFKDQLEELIEGERNG